MNIGRVEDEKNAKVDNIRKQMRQQWIPKPPEQTNQSSGSQVTLEEGGSINSNYISKKIVGTISS